MPDSHTFTDEAILALERGEPVIALVAGKMAPTAEGFLAMEANEKFWLATANALDEMSRREEDLVYRNIFKAAYGLLCNTIGIEKNA